MKNGRKIRDFIIQLDKQGEIAVGNSSDFFRYAIISSLEKAAGSQYGTDEYKEWLHAAANGNTMALRPVLDGLREQLVNLSSVY